MQKESLENWHKPSSLMQQTDRIPNSPRTPPSTGSVCCPQCLPAPQQLAEPGDKPLGTQPWLWDFLALLFWVYRFHHATHVDFHWEGHDRSSQHKAVSPSMQLRGREEPSCDRFPAIGWWLGVIIKNYGATQSLRGVAYAFRRKLNESKLEIVPYSLVKKCLQFWTQLLPMSGQISIYI